MKIFTTVNVIKRVNKAIKIIEFDKAVCKVITKKLSILLDYINTELSSCSKRW